MTFALTGARVFDGEVFHDDMAVVVDGRRILSVSSEATLLPSMRKQNLRGGILAPGFIDVQVNGGAGALLNQDPSVEVVRTIADSHRAFGTVGLLPTVITDDIAVTKKAVAAVRKARVQGMANVLGVHVEGPFLDVARKGAHHAKFIRPLSDADFDFLTTADCGCVMLTVAPNRVSPDDIQKLVAKGVLVSLGHSDAGYAQVQTALKAGATSFTHLFNAMSQLTGREPGMVGAALADQNSFVGIIADGHHVHDVSLRLALAASTPDRFMLVTDAMPPAAGGPEVFSLQGRMVLRVSGRLQLDDGTLAGSNLTMDEAVRYCVENLQVPLATALQMASRNPARFLRRHTELGSIVPGSLASLVHLDEQLRVKQTWVEGQ